MRNRIYPIALLAILLALVGCRPIVKGDNIKALSAARLEQQSTNPASGAELHLALGNPSNATSDTNNASNYLISRPQYALSYNNTLGYANWVSWHLIASHVGHVDRGSFMPDSSLPKGFKHIVPGDYTGTGYDRGHLCPSKDRSATEEDNDATFLMSNIFPQAPGNNRGPWKDLEEYSRDLVQSGKELYIIAGPALDRTTNRHKRVGKGSIKLTVPEFAWKVIVVLPAQAGDPLGRISTDTRVIAVWLPNNNSVKGKDWKTFRTTVDEIERQTGYELLSNLPKEVQDVIEARTDTE